jgi:hypothetical protein
MGVTFVLSPAKPKDKKTMMERKMMTIEGAMIEGP